MGATSRSDSSYFDWSGGGAIADKAAGLIAFDNDVNKIFILNLIGGG